MVKEIIISDTASWQSVFKLALANQMHSRFNGSIKVTFDLYDNCIIDFIYNYDPIYRYTIHNISAQILQGKCAKEFADQAIKCVKNSVMNKYFKKVSVDNSPKV